MRSRQVRVLLLSLSSVAFAACWVIIGLRATGVWARRGGQKAERGPVPAGTPAAEGARSLAEPLTVLRGPEVQGTIEYVLAAWAYRLCAASADGRVLAVQTTVRHPRVEVQVHLWGIDEERERVTWSATAAERPTLKPVVSPDGAFAAVPGARADGFGFVVYDLTSGRARWSAGQAMVCAVSPDSRWVALDVWPDGPPSAQPPRAVQVLASDSGALRASASVARAHGWSPERTLVWTRDSRSVLFDCPGGVSRLDLDTGEVEALAFASSALAEAGQTDEPRRRPSPRGDVWSEITPSATVAGQTDVDVLEAGPAPAGSELPELRTAAGPWTGYGDCWDVTGDSLLFVSVVPGATRGAIDARSLAEWRRGWRVPQVVLEGVGSFAPFDGGVWVVLESGALGIVDRATGEYREVIAAR